MFNFNLSVKIYRSIDYYTFQFITDEENSKDIVNDVFEKIWIQRHELKLETLSSYLYTLVRNRCLDYLRHKKVEQQYADLYDLISQKEFDDSELYEYRMSRIEKIIEKLGEPTKGIFRIRNMQKLLRSIILAVVA